MTLSTPDDLILKAMKSLDEIDYQILDPGIRNTVKLLREHNFQTTDSGDGKTKYDAGGWDPEELMPFPHVIIITPPDELVSESRRLRKLLEGLGHRIHENGAGEYTNDIEIHSSFDPVNDCALILLMNLHDDDLQTTGGAPN